MIKSNFKGITYIDLIARNNFAIRRADSVLDVFFLPFTPFLVKLSALSSRMLMDVGGVHRYRYRNKSPVIRSPCRIPPRRDATRGAAPTALFLRRQIFLSIFFLEERSRVIARGNEWGSEEFSPSQSVGLSDLLRGRERKGERERGREKET